MSEEINWDSLTFSLTPTDTMYITDTDINDAWMPGELIPYGDMKISPAAGVPVSYTHLTLPTILLV